jgi:hypothetical protein
MRFKILSGGPKTNKFQFIAGSPRLLFDRDLRHSGRQEDPDRNVNTPLTQAYHPTVGIRL